MPMKRFNGKPGMLRVLIVIVVLLIVLGMLWSRWPRQQAAAGAAPEAATMNLWDGGRTSFDLIVTGSEPEGIIAAVAAAQESADVLLATQSERVGGLFVTGMMNSLDLRTKPELYQRGLFETWWDQVGRGHAFDVDMAESAFERMLAEAGVEVLLGAAELAPLVEGGRVVGVDVGEAQLRAGQVIDATPEADVAAMAGADFTLGFQSLGLEARMVDTLVFKIDGVDWPALTAGIRERGSRAYAEVSSTAAWGHFGGYPASYQALEPGIRLRGLNLGLQEDGSVLVNALMIEGIDPFDTSSRQDGKARAAREAPLIVDYLRQDIPGFADAAFGGVADTLYIRESRHLEALCRLTVDDVLDNRVTEYDVAAGGYPLDVHPLTPHDTGYIFGVPEIYGVELCVTVPASPEGLWVVGKAAGYDPIAHSSARVVPFGMALAEAVGVAAATSVRQGVAPRDFARDRSKVGELRSLLQHRGAYLPEVLPRDPVGPHTHPYYPDYRLMLSRGLAVGGYDNNPQLDEAAPAISYVYLLANVAHRFLGDPDLAERLVANFQVEGLPLTPDLALNITRYAACRLDACFEPASWTALAEVGLLPEPFDPAELLTRGEVYALAAAIARLPDTDRLARGSE